MSAIYFITITIIILLITTITTITTTTIKDIMTMTPGRPSPLQPSGRKARKCQRSQQQLFAWPLAKSSQVSFHKYYLDKNRLTSTNCQILTWRKIFSTCSKTPPLADSSTERDLLNDSEGGKIFHWKYIMMAFCYIERIFSENTFKTHLFRID